MKDVIHRLRLLLAALALLLSGMAALATPATVLVRAQGGVGFASPTFVDGVRVGGEPFVLRSTKAGNLVYTSHEGATHIDREGLPSTSPLQFVCQAPAGLMCNENHVWIWTSDDKGKTWQFRDEGLTYPGFSDPDLSEDAAGNIYNTGIDLANEAVFSSQDGGKTWPHGTLQCHEGDRPWLAGGRAGEVFMSTDDQVTGTHTVYHSSTLGDSCDANGIPDAGTLGDGTSWSGFGKLLYDRFDGSLIEPAVFNHPATRAFPNGYKGVGYSRLANASAAFPAAVAQFQPHEVYTHTSVFSPFGAPQVISMDSAQNLYFAWDTDDRAATGSNGCGQLPGQPGGPTPAPNHIMFAAGKYLGAAGQWQFPAQPLSLAHQGNARVQWPWSIAGADGNVSVVWYQMDQVVDPDCDLDTSGNPAPNVKTFIYEAHITNATSASGPTVTVTNASGRYIHQGGICNSGTTCVATGQDRRLGDFFTNAVDERGCVLIASGDTTVLDALSGQPRVTSLPIFIQQNSGPSLTGQDCGAVSAAAGNSPSPTVTGTGGSPNTATGPPPRWLSAVLLAILAMASVALVAVRARAAR